MDFVIFGASGKYFMVIGSAQFGMSDCVYPCPCGYYGDGLKECTCSNSVITRYQKRISGPLLDRIDIHIEVPRVDYEKLSDDRLGEPSANVQTRVEAARAIQRKRFAATDRLQRRHAPSPDPAALPTR